MSLYESEFEHIESMINNEYIPNDNTNVTVADVDDAKKSVVLSVIRKIEGCVIRLREIHWNAKRNSLHNLTDDIIEKLSEYEDDIAEDYMGLIGIRLKPGSIVPDIPESFDTIEVCNIIISAAIELKASVDDDTAYYGICNIIDDMVHYLNKCKYLASMC